MSDDVHSAHIYENGESIFAVTIEVAGIEIPGDEPVAAGGGGTAMRNAIACRGNASG